MRHGDCACWSTARPRYGTVDGNARHCLIALLPEATWLKWSTGRGDPYCAAKFGHSMIGFREFDWQLPKYLTQAVDP